MSRWKDSSGTRIAFGTLLASAAFVMPCTAAAQDHQAVASAIKPQATTDDAKSSAQSAPSSTATDALLGDIIVTGTKQSRAQINQSVPIAITAFNADQIEALKIRDFNDIASSIPNVNFDQTTSKGTATFSIRGVGVNSSRVDTAPTVGIFVNQVYLGSTFGVLLDPFDLEGIEVLRGAQGTLFGRNVTGGAVLLNFQKPKFSSDLTARARVETGPEYNFAVAGGGPLTDTLAGRIAVIYDNDKGWFNAPLINRKHYGASEQITVRPSLRFKSGGTDVTLFGEYGRLTGDGSPGYAPEYVGNPAQNLPAAPGRPLRYGDILVTIPGYTFLEFGSVTLDARQQVNFGDDASITSITGFREINNSTLTDNDYTPAPLSLRTYATKQHQFSEELRYNGTFGAVTATTGLYYFHSFGESYTRQALINASQGGTIEEDIFGIFAQADYRPTDKLTIQLGGRYSHEKKRAMIANLASEDPSIIQAGTFGRPGSCVVRGRGGPNRCNFEYTAEQPFGNFSPKLSMQYQVADRTMLFATAQRAYRSGGFNTVSNVAFAPRPYGSEKQNAFEVGFKSDLFDRKTRINGTAYLTKIKDLQRDIFAFDAATQTTSQQTLNAADATVEGFEAELVQQIIPNVILTGQVGYTHAKFDRIKFDLTQDPASAGGPMVTDYDYQQKLVRVTPWSYGLSLNTSHDFGVANVQLRGSWNHKDGAFGVDYNVNRRDGANVLIPAVDLFDLSLTFEPRGTPLNFTLYGRNLSNALSLGNFTPLGYPAVKGCACYVNEGRVFGAEAKMKF